MFKCGSYWRFRIRSRSRWSGLTEDRVREIIHDQVVYFVREQILELVGPAKAAMMEKFDD